MAGACAATSIVSIASTISAASGNNHTDRVKSLVVVKCKVANISKALEEVFAIRNEFNIYPQYLNSQEDTTTYYTDVLPKDLMEIVMVLEAADEGTIIENFGSHQKTCFTINNCYIAVENGSPKLIFKGQVYDL